MNQCQIISNWCLEISDPAPTPEHVCGEFWMTRFKIKFEPKYHEGMESLNELLCDQEIIQENYFKNLYLDQYLEQCRDQFKN